MNEPSVPPRTSVATERLRPAASPRDVAKQTQQSAASRRTHAADRPVRTVPGIPTDHAAAAIDLLQGRLVSCIDLQLTLKHVHWNVTGPNFIAVHEMLDLFAAEVRAIVDETAERMRTLGGVPKGRPGDIVAIRWWDDYRLENGSTEQHLRELDHGYEGILLDNRRAIAHAANSDPVTEHLLLGQTAKLEKHQWLIRSFLAGPQPDASSDRFGEPDRQPTEQESAVADRLDDVTDDVREHYQEMSSTGATAKGEGRIT